MNSNLPSVSHSQSPWSPSRRRRTPRHTKLCWPTTCSRSRPGQRTVSTSHSAGLLLSPSFHAWLSCLIIHQSDAIYYLPIPHFIKAFYARVICYLGRNYWKNAFQNTVLEVHRMHRVFCSKFLEAAVTTWTVSITLLGDLQGVCIFY